MPFGTVWKKIELPVLLDSAYFASFLKQDKLNLFPAAAYTERPATACARLCEGKAVVLVAGCPYAMVVPSFFAEHFECLDDYASGAVFAGLIRLLKYLAFLLSVFGPGLYVMAVAFAPEIIPAQLLTKLAQAEAQTPLPPMLEMLAVTLLLEIVREAGLRAPQSISHTVSIVGALIIGETAVNAGIVSVPVLTMAAAATIAPLAVPSLYEQRHFVSLLCHSAGRAVRRAGADLRRADDLSHGLRQRALRVRLSLPADAPGQSQRPGRFCAQYLVRAGQSRGGDRPP